MSDIVTADRKPAAVETDSGDYVNALVRGLEVMRAQCKLPIPDQAWLQIPIPELPLQVR